MSKRKTTRLCALCDKIIPDTYIVCGEHYQDYLAYRDEKWFQELVMAQRRQFEIDTIEAAMSDGTSKITKSYQRLTDSEKAAIRFLKSRRLGYKTIAKVLGIKRTTIRNYIKTLYTDKQ